MLLGAASSEPKLMDIQVVRQGRQLNSDQVMELIRPISSQEIDDVVSSIHEDKAQVMMV